MSQLDVIVRDSVFNPNLSPSEKRKVHVSRDADGRPLYKVWLYLEGRDVISLKKVTYTLHESFAQPVQTVRRSPTNPNFQLIIWTWGVFPVVVQMVHRRGYVYELVHRLNYVEELPSDSSLYVYDKDDAEASQRPTLKSTVEAS
jgi:transcription initiation factor IIF auxiliary subunit